MATVKYVGKNLADIAAFFRDRAVSVQKQRGTYGKLTVVQRAEFDTEINTWLAAAEILDNTSISAKED